MQIPILSRIFGKKEPDPIQRGGVSSVASTAGTAAKWGVVGALLAAALPFALGAGTLLGAYGIFSYGLAAGGTLGTLGAYIGAAGTLLFGGIVTLASAPLSLTGVGVAAGVGAAVGGIKGAKRVSRENEAYLDKVDDAQQASQNQLNSQLNNTYVIGRQDERLQLMNELHAMAANGEKRNVGQHTGAKIAEQAATAVTAGVTPRVGG